MQFPYDIGVLGGGQLARMSIMAAQRMGLSCLSLDPGNDTPASHVAPAISAALNDVEALTSVFQQCAVVTLENEFVPAKSIRRALQESGRPPASLVPNLEALAIIQDKLLQRQALQKARIPCPKAVALDDDGTRAISSIGFPMVLKSRFGGYDGKGVRYAHNAEEFENHRTTWMNGGWLAEEHVDFKRELAVMAFVGPECSGCFPTMVTEQVNHVCDLVYPTDDVDASGIALGAILAIQGVGLFGVELFESKDGKILVNELAPRPHNSGHYSMDWGGVSQFDQHIRMILGLKPAPVDGSPTCMANLLGQEGAVEWRRGLFAAIQQDPSVEVHWYGKSESRPGRKMGHINVTGLDIVERAKAARARFYEAWVGTKSDGEVG